MWLNEKADKVDHVRAIEALDEIPHRCCIWCHSQKSPWSCPRWRRTIWLHRLLPVVSDIVNVYDQGSFLGLMYAMLDLDFSLQTATDVKCHAYEVPTWAVRRSLCWPSLGTINAAVGVPITWQIHTHILQTDMRTHTHTHTHTHRPFFQGGVCYSLPYQLHSGVYHTNVHSFLTS